MAIYPEEIELRQVVARTYTDALRRTETNVVPPCVPERSISVWAQYTLRCQSRDELLVHLKQEGIPSMIYYVKPMHLLDAMANLGHVEGDFPVAEEAARTVLSLPFYPYLENDQVSKIADAVACMVAD